MSEYSGQGGEYAGVLQSSQGIELFADQFMKGRQQQQQQQMLQQKMAADQREQDLKAFNDNAEFLNQQFEAKQWLTGSQFDPTIVKGIQGSVQQAMGLLQANPKMTKAQLVMAIQPMLGRLSEYKSKAQQFDANLKVVSEGLKNIPGTSPERAQQLLKSVAMQRGIDGIPTTAEEMMGIINQNDDKIVVSDEGIQKVLDRQGKADVSKSLTRKDKSGRTTMEDVRYNLPSFADIGEDGRPTVKGEAFSIDRPASQLPPLVVNGREIDRNGKIAAQVYLADMVAGKDGKVMLMAEPEFNNLMQDEAFRRAINARSKAYIDDYEQQTGEKFPRGSVYENMIQRAKAFEAATQFVDTKFVEKQKDMAPRITVVNRGSGSGSGKDKDVPIIDLHSEMKTNFDNVSGTNIPGMGVMKIVGLDDPMWSGDFRTRVLEAARDDAGTKEGVTADQFTIYQDARGNYRLFRKGQKAGEQPKFIINLDRRFLNKDGQVNVKAKEEVVRQSKNAGGQSGKPAATTTKKKKAY